MAKTKKLTVQVKLEVAYHDQLMNFCQRNGITKADAMRYMMDTLRLDEVSDAEFDRWYDERYNLA